MYRLLCTLGCAGGSDPALKLWWIDIRGRNGESGPPAPVPPWMSHNGTNGIHREDAKRVVVAQYSCNAEASDELSFKAGDKIVVTRQDDIGWWEGSLNGKIGLFPSNYVRLASPEESEDVGGLVSIDGAARRRRHEGGSCAAEHCAGCSIQ